jgi:hypothetical protein
VRISRRSLRARVKGSLPIRFTDEKLTSYGGLELIRQFLRSSGFLARLKEVFAVREFDTDYGSSVAADFTTSGCWPMTRSFFALLSSRDCRTFARPRAGSGV